MKQDEIDYHAWKNQIKAKNDKKKLVEEAFKSRKIKPKSPKKKVKKESKKTYSGVKMYSNSAGRGVGMINRIESKASLPHVILKPDAEIKLLTLRDKLKKLLDRYPENSFYQSLTKWRGSFSEKQANSIEDNFRKCFLSEFFVEESKKKQALTRIGAADQEESPEDECPF